MCLATRDTEVVVAAAAKAVERASDGKSTRVALAALNTWETRTSTLLDLVEGELSQVECASLVSTDQWSPDVIGGSARVAAETARALAARGHDVVVLAPSRGGSPALERHGRLELHRAIRRGPFPQTFADVIETRRVARRNGRDFDVLLAHQSTNAVGLSTAGLRIPLALVFHASVPLEQRFMRSRLPVGKRLASLALSPAFAWLEQRALAAADIVLVLSEYSRTLLVRAHPDVENRIVRVVGGIDVNAFSSTRRLEARARLGIPDTTHFLITVRRLDPRMGLEEMLRAASLLRDPRQRVRSLDRR